MKGIFFTLLLFLGVLNGFSQSQYQRMLIPTGNLTLDASGGKSVQSVLGKCIDPFAKVPTSDISLSNILQNSESVNVQFLDDLEPRNVSLRSIIGNKNGIKITGNKTLTLQESRRYGEVQIYVKFENYTTRPLKLQIKEDIVVGQENDPLLKKYADKPQLELWDQEYLQYTNDLNSLGFISGNISDNVHDFKIEHFADYKENVPKEAFENRLAELIELKKYDSEILNAFKNSDIGIMGKSSAVLIKEFNKAAKKNANPRNIIAELTKEVVSKKFYVYSKSADEYIPFIRSKRIDGMLFKHTAYVAKYHARIENNLFEKRIGHENIEVLNFLDKTEDERTYNFLKGLFRKNSSDFTFQSLGKLKKRLKDKNIEYLFCFGHYEQGSIFTHVGKERIKHKYDIGLLKRIAKELDVKLFFIGCKSSIVTGGGTGTTINVNSLKVLEDLFVSLENSKNLGEFLSSLGKKGGSKKTYTYEFDENTGIVRIRTYDSKNGYYDSTTSQVIIEFDLYNFYDITSNFPTALETLTDIIESDEEQSTTNK